VIRKGREIALPDDDLSGREEPDGSNADMDRFNPAGFLKV